MRQNLAAIVPFGVFGVQSVGQAWSQRRSGADATRPVRAADVTVSVHLINLLSTLLRCSGFRDSESCGGSASSRPPAETMAFIGASWALRP